MSTTTVVRLAFSNAPASVSGPSDVQVSLAGSTVTVLSLITVTPGTIEVSIRVPPSSSSGAVAGRVTFLADATLDVTFEVRERVRY